MFNSTPSFAQNPSLTVNQHYVSDQNHYQNTIQTPQTDYIKILEFNRSDSYGSAPEQSVSRSSNSSREPVLSSRQMYQNSNHETSPPQESSIKQKIGISTPERLPPREDKNKMISEYLIEAFKQDSGIRDYLKGMVTGSKTSSSVQKNSVNDKQGTGAIKSNKPPKYKPIQHKPQPKLAERSLQDIKEEREEEEELRPRDNIPQPFRALEVEEGIRRSKELDKRITKSKSPEERQAEVEQKSFGALKKFYQGVVGDKRKGKVRHIEETKRHLEETLFEEDREDKENLTPNYNHKERFNSQHKNSSKYESPITQQESQRRTGLIVRRNQHSVSSYSNWNTRDTVDEEVESRDLFGRSIQNLDAKFKWRSQVLRMQENELNETFEAVKGGVVELRSKLVRCIEERIEVPRETMSIFVDDEYDLERNRQTIEALQFVKRGDILRYIGVIQKFSHLKFLKEIVENKSKIRKVNMSISKLRRENHKIQTLLKEETIIGKKNIRKDKKPQDAGQLKRTSYQENETKIIMMNDIKLRLIQKNVLLILKWSYVSAKTRNELIQNLQGAYTKKICYYVFAGLYFNKQYKIDSRKQQHLAIEHMSNFWTGQLLHGWSKVIRLRQQKRMLHEGLRKYSIEKLKKRGFYGILMRIQYKKTIKADIPLADKFRQCRLLMKGLLGFKYSADFVEFTNSKKKSFQNFNSGNSIVDPDEKSFKEIVYNVKDIYASYTKILKDSLRMSKLVGNKLSILSSRREYHYEPLLKIRTLLRPRYTSSNAPSILLKSVIPTNSQSRSILTEAHSPAQNLVYKRKHYLLDKISQGHVFAELKDHIQSLIKVKKALEVGPAANLDLSRPRGMINLQALQRFVAEKEERRAKAQLFNRWKIAFIGKCTDVEVDLYHAMKLSKLMFSKFRSVITQRALLEESLVHQDKYSLINKAFKALKESYMTVRLEQERVVRVYREGQVWDRWRTHHEKRQTKNELYGKFRSCYYAKLKLLACKAWRMVTTKNKQIRETTKKFSHQRVLKQWKRKYNSKVLLKNVFGTFINRTNYYFDHAPKNEFQMLSSIMKAWREEVIENESTAEQRINILTAQNHRKQSLQVKSFRAWKNIPSHIKSLSLMTEIFKSNFRKNVYKRWSYITQYTLYRIASFQENQQRLKIRRCFQELYRSSLKPKLVRFFVVKKFFLKWNAHVHLKTEVLPRRCYMHHLYRTFFDRLKEKRRNKILELKCKFIANQHSKKTERPLLQKAFYRLNEYMLRNRRKKIFYYRLRIFREKALLNMAWGAWDKLKFLKLMNEKKERMADAFRQNRIRSWQKLQSGTKTMSLQYQTLNLAFNGWRAHALKSRNVKHIVERFRRFKKRINLRSFFNYWHQQYRERRINSYQLPSLNISFSKYLKTDAEKMRRFEDSQQRAGERRYERSDNYEHYDPVTPSWQEIRYNNHQSEEDCQSDRELYLEGYRKNEEFLRKLKELKEMEENYSKNYY